MADYELMGEPQYRHSWWRISTLVMLYMLTTVLVFLSWNSAYNTLYYPPKTYEVPEFWYRRANIYANSVHHEHSLSHDFRLVKNQTGTRNKTQNNTLDGLVDNELQPLPAVTTQESMPALPPIMHAPTATTTPLLRLVCYYAIPESTKNFNDLRLRDVSADLCTHIHIGMAGVRNGSLVFTQNLEQVLLQDVPQLRTQNPALKLLLWVGGGGNSDGFPAMVKNHATRKVFVHAVKEALAAYKLDGLDLDWEFPSAYNKERQHFSQLLYEIKEEYRRERRDYLLSVAVAAPEGIALFAYDVRMLNEYADYVSLMTYDYHFYSRGTPFTGLNAPLYARPNEHSLLGTLNINYSVNWWLSRGLERKKLVVGLPTYGHSFTLINAFNNGIGAPAEDIGQCGSLGFATYSDVCWFNTHNILVQLFYDQPTCSPYLSSGTEWISYENETSIACKTLYIKSHNLGGAMIFSLNTDDVKGYCARHYNSKFPLTETVRAVLYGNS